MDNKKAQIGIEYLVVISFVTLVVLIVLSFALYYSSSVQNSIRLNQVESFASKVVSSSESVFYSGEPSKATIRLSLPSGVNDISFTDEGLLITVQVGSRENIRLFESNVPLSGSIETTQGIKVITLTATDTGVVIS